MKFIEDNFRDFLLQFDTFIIDVYKTIERNTGELIDGVKENIEFLAKNDKNIIIFTNYPLSNALCFTSSNYAYFKNLGISQYTSGEICHKILKQKFSSYFLFGSRPIPDLQQVDYYGSADFVYLDLPALPKRLLKPEGLVNIDKFPNVFFSKDVEAFVPFLKNLLQQNKIIYSGKPSINDYMNFSQNPSDKRFMDMQNHIVVSNKQIVNKYRELGGVAMEIGKPYTESYKFFLSGKENKILCVGDTMETDILGAKNLKNDGYSAFSLLVLTGESSLNNIKNYSYQPDYISSSFGL